MTTMTMGSAPHSPEGIPFPQSHGHTPVSGMGLSQHLLYPPHPLSHAVSFAQLILQQQHEQQQRQQIQSAFGIQRTGSDAFQHQVYNQHPQTRSPADTDFLGAGAQAQQSQLQLQSAHAQTHEQTAHAHAPSHIAMPYSTQYVFEFLSSGLNSPYGPYGDMGMTWGMSMASGGRYGPSAEQAQALRSGGAEYPNPNLNQGQGDEFVVGCGGCGHAGTVEDGVTGAGSGWPRG